MGIGSGGVAGHFKFYHKVHGGGVLGYIVFPAEAGIVYSIIGCIIHFGCQSGYILLGIVNVYPADVFYGPGSGES